MKKYTHNNNQLTIKNISQQVYLKGWVAKKRDLGGLIFIDLRDRFGITQLVIRPDSLYYNLALELKNEYVIEAKGKVIERESKNKQIKTGDIEILVDELILLNQANPTPISVSYDDNALEETRLKYRYLDLRRPFQQKYLLKRAEAVQAIRKVLLDKKFYELETPTLGKSTPEGARDFLVPSRLYHGQYYALPQSPQIYKQLYMISGFEKYFQFAKCYRDEDLRSDRQLEFTQVDIEASFIDENYIYELVEDIITDTFKEVININLEKPFKRITYQEALDLYGSDKPDLRYQLILNTPKKELDIPFLDKKAVRYLTVENGASFSRKTLDKLNLEAKKNHGDGIAYLKYQDGELTGSVAKFFKEEAVSDFDLKDGYLMVFVYAATYEKASIAGGAVRKMIANELNLVNDDLFVPLWVVDFPLFEYSEEEQRYVARHHPFTAAKNNKDLNGPLKDIIANAYDIVINGYEIGGGSIRIHNSQVQQKMFELLGLDQKTVKQRFGFLIEALTYGTPPHGGIALGLDRIVMLLTKTKNIKDVIAFPKTQSGRDLMMGSPDHVDLKQEIELGLKKEK